MARKSVQKQDSASKEARQRKATRERTRKMRARKKQQVSKERIERLAAKRREEYMQRLDAWLAEDAQKGRTITLLEVTTALGRQKTAWFKSQIGLMEFGRLFLKHNPDAKPEIKAYYKSFLEREVEKANANLTLAINTPTKKLLKKVNADVVKGQLRQLDALASIKQSANESLAPSAAQQVVPRTPQEEAISRIRDAYINAPLGEFPTLDNIMRAFGLIDKDGRPTAGAIVTEEEVRKRAIAEDWREDRKKSIHTRWDFVSDEVKITTLMRNVEVQKILYNTIKLQSRAVTQYHTLGYVTSLQPDPDTGRPRVLNLTPDPLVIGSLAEVMRRMTDSHHEFSIQINQFNNIDQSNSLFMKQYVNQLAGMDAGSLKSEIERIARIRSVLDDGFQDALLSEASECIEVEAVK